MGSHNFEHRQRGDTAALAYAEACRQAEYEDGHSSYSGTIATTNGFKMKPVPKGKDLDAHVEDIINNDPSIEKWGNCACIEMEPGDFLFFGWAAS